MKYLSFRLSGAGLILLVITAMLFIGGFKKPTPAVPVLSNFKVPPGFVVESAVAPGLVNYPMFATFDNQGQLFVIESSGKTTSTEDVLKNPTFKILLLTDADADGIFEKKQVYADNIPYPMGGAYYQGSFYVAAPPQLLRFTDTNADGKADKKEEILSGWVLNHNAATLSGPFVGPDGWLYLCDARRGFNIKTKEGTVLQGKGARIWRCRPDGTGLESLAGGGFDNTIEMIFMPSGETIGTMTYFTDPRDGYRDALMHWVEGGVYPKPYPVIQQDSLKLTGELMPVMTKLPRVSHSGLMRYRSNIFGEAYKGNLFSAQFNTGRIMRHTVTPNGATYRTTEEVFMQADSLDSHPTDVLEDANGSLLVVNTGGWFIAGCPLSVVAKTDIKGSIIRIRKANAPKVADPWGIKLNLAAASPAQLITYLKDARPAVRDNAIEYLVAAGAPAVKPLLQVLNSSESEELRTAAVFMLYRLQRPEATAGVLSALNDKNPLVRTAAARALGLAKEKKALPTLMTLVQQDKAPVRRQAATALGQIGDKAAIPALLKAAGTANDRFVEHAIIYSLITLNQPQPLMAALNNSAVKVRQAALVALDQIDNSPLSSADLVPFLTSTDEQLQKTAVWVAAHHPKWSGVVTEYIASQITQKEISEAGSKNLTALMLNFSGDVGLQKFIAAQLSNNQTPVAKKRLLLNVIRQSSLKEYPTVWVQVLGAMLADDKAEMRNEVLDLISTRNIPALTPKLDQIIQDPNKPAELKLKALSARIISRPKLSGAEFQLLLDLAKPANSYAIRQASVRLQAQAELTETQLEQVAQEEVPQADVMLLPSLVNIFEGDKSEKVGLALIGSLQKNNKNLDNLSLPVIQNLLANYPAPVKAAAEPLLKTLEAQQAARLAHLQKLEASLKGGDVGEGRKLFYGKAVCSSCHAVVGQGGEFGPDLTNIGEIRSKHDILEAIVYPSASFAREYETSKITTQAASYTGIIKEQLPEYIMLETGPGVRVRITRNEIKTIEPHTVSLMPPGLNQQLSTNQMADLIAYLKSLPDGLGQIKKL